MKRGPKPHKGFDVAMPYASKRGQVMRFLPCPWYACDFVIAGTGCLAVVCLRLAQRLRATVAEIQVEYSKPVAGLGTIPGGGPVSRELWLYSRSGTLRFFRTGKAGLEEIDHHGDVFVEGKSAIVPQKNPVNPNINPGTAVVTGAIVAGTLDPGSPIIRWLKKRNALLKAAGEGKQAIGLGEPGGKTGTAQPSRGAKEKKRTATASPPQGPEGGAGPAGTPDENPPVGYQNPDPDTGKARGEI